VREQVIIAGPNGSGKSTLASQLDFKGDFISADKCEKLVLSDVTSKSSREQRAVILVAKEMLDYINREESFAFETVFATAQIPSFIISAKENGYQIILHYVSTQSVDINLDRVRKRVKQGGHDVPEDKIRERYAKTLAILQRLLDIADEAILYDNSGKSLYPFLVKENGQVKIVNAPPEWARGALNLY